MESADEADGNQAETEQVSQAANTTDQPEKREDLQQEASTSGSGGGTTESRPHTKRNYRRRTLSGESSSDEEVEQGTEAVENVAEDQQPSESEDVSLDELRVSGSEEADNRSSRR
jgi:hypothetical protein